MLLLLAPYCHLRAFGEGGMRLCYKAEELDASSNNNEEQGIPSVIKVFKPPMADNKQVVLIFSSWLNGR